jgi:hypothetical protein
LGQSLQAKNVNGNAMDGMFVVVTTVQQIMIELSRTATDQEKAGIITIITKAVINLVNNLLKSNGKNNS